MLAEAHDINESSCPVPVDLRRRLELELSACVRHVSPLEEPALVHEARADDVEGGGEEAGGEGGAERAHRVVAHVVVDHAVPDQRGARVVVRR